jgi:hypothetical protein
VPIGTPGASSKCWASRPKFWDSLASPMIGVCRQISKDVLDGSSSSVTLLLQGPTGRQRVHSEDCSTIGWACNSSSTVGIWRSNGGPSIKSYVQELQKSDEIGLIPPLANRTYPSRVRYWRPNPCRGLIQTHLRYDWPVQ